MLDPRARCAAALVLGAVAGLAAAQAGPAAALPEVRVIDNSSTTEGRYIARELDLGKLGQAPRQIPQSVSVITRQQLDDDNATRLEDAVKAVTGITVTRLDGAGNYSTILSRGFGIGAELLDGLPIASGANYATSLDLALYDRIEVLRGPAGLLLGTGEPGGAVNLVRKRALGRLALSGAVLYGSFGLRRAQADLSAPLNAARSLRGRVVVVEDRRDSFIDLLFSRKHVAYGTLELDITPATTLSVGAARQRVDAMADEGLPARADGQLLHVQRSTLIGTRANRQDLDMRDLFAELEHRLANGGQIKAALRDVRRENFYRVGRALGPVADNGDFAFGTADFRGVLNDRSLDLHLATPFSLAGRRHRLLLGANHNERETLDNNFVLGQRGTAHLADPASYLDWAYPPVRLPGYASRTTRAEKALYGQLQASVTDRLRLLAGGRVSWVRERVTRSSDGQVTARSDPGRKFTPHLAALFDLTPQLTAYASRVESFVVQPLTDAAGQLLPARRARQWEVGLKGEFLAKRLQTQAALFRIDDRNRALPDPGVRNAYLPGGQVRSEGLELEVSGQVGHGWDLLAGYAHTRTRYVQAPAAQQGLVFAPVTPRHVVNLSTRYAVRDGALCGLSLGGGISWRSSAYAQAGALRVVSGSRALADLQLGYAIDNHIELGLSVENLFDKTYYEGVQGVGRLNFYGSPRSAVLALRVRY